MIKVEYKKLRAVWDFGAGKWKPASRRLLDQNFAEMLNGALPEKIVDEELSPQDVYYKGKNGVNGIDGIVLDALGFLGTDLKVIESKPDPIPEEEEGKVV